MKELSFDTVKNADFTLYEGNPVIKHRKTSFVAADPTVLTPEQTPDGVWHLFCHSFYGIDHYRSLDGIAFERLGQVIGNAQRPDIKLIDGEYVLFYEATRSTPMRLMSLFGVPWHSQICAVRSKDLKHWSAPVRVLEHSRSFESDERGVALSNPFLLKLPEGYRLYYSCGQTFIKDCGFCEPTYISYASAKTPLGKYEAREQPIIRPDKSISYLNLCSGCIKVYKLKDCYIGLQNGIYTKQGKSHSAIMLLRSEDGVSFEPKRELMVPQRCADSDWMAQYVYACSLVRYKDELRLYFNARNVADTLKGRESIGFASAKIPE